MSEEMEEAASMILLALCARAVGHTHAMMKGAENVDCKVIGGNHQSAKAIAGKKGISLLNLRQELRGYHGPIVLDNFALEMLLRGLMKRIAALKAKEPPCPKN